MRFEKNIEVKTCCKRLMYRVDVIVSAVVLVKIMMMYLCRLVYSEVILPPTLLISVKILFLRFDNIYLLMVSSEINLGVNGIAGCCNYRCATSVGVSKHFHILIMWLDFLLKDFIHHFEPYCQICFFFAELIIH